MHLLNIKRISFVFVFIFFIFTFNLNSSTGSDFTGSNNKNTLKSMSIGGLVGQISWNKIKPGDTIYGLLAKYGFGKVSIQDLSINQSTKKIWLNLIPESLYAFVTNPKTKDKALQLFDLETDSSLSVLKTKNETLVTHDPIQYEIKTRELKGKVKGSLISSITQLGVDKLIAYRLLDAFVLDYNLPKQLSSGAQFRILFEEKYLNGKLIKPGELLEVDLEIENKTVSKKFVVYDGGGSFVSLGENQFNDKPLFSPVAYQHYSSLFKKRRFHPIKRRRQAHLGIDFALPEGSSVFSVSPGKVLRFGKNRASGNFVVIDHGNRLESYYNHLSKIHPNIYEGKVITNGEVIGYIGCTGYCTKAHLHLAIKQNGNFVNPAPLLKPYPFIAKKLIEDQKNLYVLNSDTENN